jgi:hypothetical protein
VSPSAGPSSAGRPPDPTRADHLRFVTIEGWRPVASTHHATFELPLADGRVLRTRISRPPDRTTYGPRMWAHVLRDQLRVTETEFRACVDDGVLPDRARRADEAPSPTTIPVEVADLLSTRIGLRREDLVGMSREAAIARLGAYWTTGR